MSPTISYSGVGWVGITAKVRSQPLPGSYMVMNNCEMLEMRCWNIIRHVQNMHHKQNVGSVKKVKLYSKFAIYYGPKCMMYIGLQIYLFPM